MSILSPSLLRASRRDPRASREIRWHRRAAAPSTPTTSGSSFARQDERKASIERRGVSVITTSGVLVSLLFGLTTVLTGTDNYQLPSGTKPLDLWFFGLLRPRCGWSITNIPLFYSGVEVKGLEAATKHKMGDSVADANVRVASTDVKLLATAQKLNSVKGWILLGAAVARWGRWCPWLWR